MKVETSGRPGQSRDSIFSSFSSSPRHLTTRSCSLHCPSNTVSLPFIFFTWCSNVTRVFTCSSNGVDSSKGGLVPFIPNIYSGDCVYLLGNVWALLSDFHTLKCLKMLGADWTQPFVCDEGKKNFHVNLNMIPVVWLYMRHPILSFTHSWSCPACP